MLILDKMPVEGTRRRTADGYLVAQGRAARVGVQTYLGAEVGKPGMSTVRVYRPEEEVFKVDSLGSFPHKPITLGHPPDGVSAANWRQHAIGFVGGEVARDGDHIAIPLLFADATAIGQLEAGVKELSGGYSCDLDWTAGRSPAGDAYDAIQRNIRINHVALVERGRAGSTVRVGDAATGVTTMNIQDALQGIAPGIRTTIYTAQGLIADSSRGCIENGIEMLRAAQGKVMNDQVPGAQRRVTTDSAVATYLADYIGGLIASGQERLLQAARP